MSNIRFEHIKHSAANEQEAQLILEGQAQHTHDTDNPFDPRQDFPDSLKKVDIEVIMRAKLIASHLLCDDGAKILDFGSDEGYLTALVAYFCPRHEFIGIDWDADKIKRSKQRFKSIENLSFQRATIGETLHFDDQTIDCIINSRILGDIFSRSDYSERAVYNVLDDQFRLLKPDGHLVIYDYIKRPDDDYTLIEFPVIERDGAAQPPSVSGFKVGAMPRKETKGDKDAQDLLWFSENARPKEAFGCQGFFLEELPSRVPYTRLFRLPAKWANEFVIRKTGTASQDFRDNIDREYAVFNDMDFYKVFRKLDAHVLFSAPWTNPHVVKTQYEGCFRLYHDNGKKAPYPPTGFVVHVQKPAASKSVYLHELRASKTGPSNLQVQTYRDEETGQLVDIVERSNPQMNVIPYVVDEQSGRLKIYLHDSAPQCVTNIVPRGGHNLDGKRWSGYMVKALSFAQAPFKAALEQGYTTATKLFIQETGLHPLLMNKATPEDVFIKGPEGYPAPDLIGEVVQTRFVQVKNGQEPKPPHFNDNDDFPLSSMAENTLKAYDAEDILRAIGAGLIPCGWLEIQIQGLFEMLGFNVPHWLQEALPIGTEVPDPDQILHAKDILSQSGLRAGEEDAQDEDDGDASAQGSGEGGIIHHAAANTPKTRREKRKRKVAAENKEQTDKAGENYLVDPRKAAQKDSRFRKVKGAAGQVRTMRSVFIDEGVEDGRILGLSSREADFAMIEDETVNKAAVMPLTQDLNGDTLVGFELEEYPVPHRFGETNKIINLPTFTLPKDVTTMEEAKAFVAEKFEVSSSAVTAMGEGFFTYIDMTPQRIFPFSIAGPAGGSHWKKKYGCTSKLWKITDLDYKWSMLFTWGAAYQRLGLNHGAVRADYNPAHAAKARKFESKKPSLTTTTDSLGRSESTPYQTLGGAADAAGPVTSSPSPSPSQTAQQTESPMRKSRKNSYTTLCPKE